MHPAAPPGTQRIESNPGRAERLHTECMHARGALRCVGAEVRECACVGSVSHLSLFVTVTVRLVAPPPPSVPDRCRKHHAAPAVGVAAGPPCGPGSGSGAPESKRSGPLRSFTHGSEAKNWPETEHSTEQTVRGMCEVCAGRS